MRYGVSWGGRVWLWWGASTGGCWMSGCTGVSALQGYGSNKERNYQGRGEYIGGDNGSVMINHEVQCKAIRKHTHSPLSCVEY